MAVAAEPRPRRLGRLERSALTGVLVREVVNFSSYWKSSTFSSTVEPTIYLLAFGFGFGALVGQIGGYDYVEFVGTGTVATAVLFSSAFPAMFGTFVKYQFQRTYDAILAAPVDTEELVTAEALWIATRASVYGCVPMLVAIVFGLDPVPAMLLVPPIAWISGFGWACFGISVAGFSKSFENFNYVVSAVLTPLFLVAGTFFPLETLPGVGAAPRRPEPAPPHRRARPPCRVRLGRLDGLPARRRARRLRLDPLARRDQGDDPEADRLAPGRCRASVRTATTTSTSASRAPRTGVAIASTEMPAAPPASAVETAGLAAPAVVTVEVSRVAPVNMCTVPAIPPPATIASVHFSQGPTSTIAEALRIVPATTAAGAASASRTLSRSGIT